MALTITCINAIKTNGAITVQFSDGMALEYPDLDSMKAAVDEFNKNTEIAKMMLLAYWIANDAQLSNTSVIKNKTMTIDSSSTTTFKIT